MQEQSKPRGLSNFKLKVIGAVLMLLSMASSRVGAGLVSTGGAAAAGSDMTTLSIAVLGELVSWAAVPIYAWLLVEGYRHTHNVWAYMGRLLALALVCEVPYDLVTSGKAVDWSSQNPVFALVITLFALVLIDAFRGNDHGDGSDGDNSGDGAGAVRRRGGAALAFALIAATGVAWMVFGKIGVRERFIYLGALLFLAAVIFRFFPRHENSMMMGVAALGALFGVTPAFGIAVLHFRTNELGYARPWTQWVFYALYPMLLLVFAFVQVG